MSCEITYEELAAYTEGDVSAERHAMIDRHVATCEDCRQRLTTLAKADTALRHVPAAQPSPGTILATRRLLAEETRPKREPEILTLEEVAEFLRIDPEELRPFVAELPAFELGGQIRMRRSKLLEWVEQREQQFSRGNIAGAMARIRSGGLQKGVA